MTTTDLWPHPLESCHGEIEPSLVWNSELLLDPFLHSAFCLLHSFGASPFPINYQPITINCLFTPALKPFKKFLLLETKLASSLESRLNLTMQRGGIPMFGLLVFSLSMILLAGCASDDRPTSTKAIPPQAQSRESNDSLREWALAAEWSALVAAGDAMHPILSDELLITGFQHHRDTFEKLRQMIAADPGLHLVGEDGTNPRNPAEIGVSPERIAEYRRLLTEIGCSKGLAAYPARPGIYFISGVHGISIAGSTKGYYYLETTPSSIVTNTATYTPTNTVDYEIFRPIEGHWYIYFENR